METINDKIEPATLNPNKDNCLFGQCKVCKSDAASGIHYGVATCDGCKAFYKRSIAMKRSYMCYFQNNCLSNHQVKRILCKACRLKKCIQVGMSFEKIKLGRIPDSEKARTYHHKHRNLNLSNLNQDNLKIELRNRLLTKMNTEQIGYPQPTNSLANGDSNLMTTGTTIYLNFDFSDFAYENKMLNTEMFQNHFGEFKPKLFEFFIEHFQSSLFTINSTKLYNNPERKSEYKAFISFDEMKPLLNETNYHHNKWLIDLVKDLPFFESLNDTDLAKIIFHGQIATFSFKMAQFVRDNESHSVMENNLWISRNVMGIIVGNDTADLLFNNQLNIRDLNLSLNEQALIYLFLLAQCDINIIEDKILYKNLKKYYTSALMAELKENKRNEKFIETLINCFRRYAFSNNIVNEYRRKFKAIDQ